MFKHMLIIISCLSFISAESDNKGKLKLVIDNDAGGDDAMAIFLGLLYEKHFNGPEIIGLTTVNGNTNEDNVSYNNQRILKVAKRQNVPIYRGAKRSLVITPLAGSYFGEDGLGDGNETLTGLVPPDRQKAVSSLIHLSKVYAGDLIVASIGSLTNIGLAISIDPTFLERLNQLYIGAGHIYSDQHNEPEFNAHTDVEAYHIITENASPDKVTALPFSQVQIWLNFSREWRENVLGAIDTDIMRAQNIYERISLPKSDRWQALDPAVIGIIVKPDLVEEYKYSKNNIVICSKDRGIITNSFVEKKDANMRLVYSIKTEAYKQFLLDVFSTDENN